MRILCAAVLSIVVVLSTAPAVADSDLAATARSAVSTFVEAVIAGPDTLAPVLAPEYQLLRADGTGYAREDYLARGAGTVSIAPVYAVEDIVATSAGGLLVARYMLHIDGTIEGEAVARRAPRLTVFRMIDGQWKVVAHANFADTN